MEKSARNKSDDPVQEALRAHKDKWNLDAKEFIARMIAFKRGLNGRGDPKYSLPPGSIKDPLPQTVASFLSEISNNFEQLTNEALKIEQEQAAYSQNRRKSQPQQPGHPAPEVPKTASASSSKLSIGQYEVSTLIAVSEEEQARGLMEREWPPPVMSFLYASPRVNRFWMKNTPSPLDIVFALNGTITSICKGEPHSTAMVGDYAFSDLVVELPFGTCTKLGIKVGDPVRVANSLNFVKNFK